MGKANGFLRTTVLFGLALCVAGLAATALAGPIDGGLEREPLGSCNTYADTVYVGTTAVAVGDEAAIAIRVGCDEPSNGFSIYLQLPAYVTSYSQVRVENGACPWDVQDWNLDINTHKLLINYTGGGGFYTFHTDEVFLWVYLDTHCWQIDEYQEDITLLRGLDLLPDSYFAHPDCTQDPIDIWDDGFVWFHNWLQWRITDETAIIGENATVTVSCVNSIEFSSFSHAVSYNSDALELVDVIAVGPTVGELEFDPLQNPIPVSGDRPDGFGESNNPVAFYQIVFKVITHRDDITTVVSFSPTPREMVALDCGQLLHEIPSSISYNQGSVTVPPYRAEFDIGDAVWTNFAADPGEVRVPLWLKNNYEVTAFNLAMSYAGDVEDGHLEFIDFEGAEGYDLTGMNQYCGGGDPYWYAKLETVWDQHIPAAEESRIIGYFVFTRDAGDTPDPNTEYALQFIDNGCGTYPTWVKLDDAGDFDTTYAVPAPQVVFTPGIITIEPPLVWVNVPGVNGQCDKFGENCEWWKSTSFNVNSNIDLDSVTFKVTWSPDEFCVDDHDLQGDVDVWDTDDMEVTITIRDIAASPDWVWYGCLKFTNAEFTENWGDIEVVEVTPFETYPVGTIATDGTAGGIHLEAMPMDRLPCDGSDEIPVDRKPSVVPSQFALLQNRPNPFNASTVIDFAVPEPAQTTLEIYNVMGRRVATLMDDYIPAGQYSVTWNGRDEYGSAAASGIYFYRLRAGSFAETRKMVLMK